MSKIESNKVYLDIHQGCIAGVESILPNGRPYSSFRGIPYAQPPLGNLRFAAPKPIAKFRESVLDCSRERDPCYHKDMISFKSIGSEDCLYLNVYTPNVSYPKLPVMIWLHGGDFASGSGSSDYYSPEYLVEQNVVIVTINYRLSILGFLCLPDAGIYGNAGLKDQRLAMQWVQENIAKFGGNPDNVTLFGQSAGAASVHIHALSASSRKYFHKAICQSGNAVMEWVMQSNAEEKSKMLAKSLGCQEIDSYKILDFLRGIDDLSILFRETSGTMTGDEKRRGLPIVFKPNIEIENVEAIITEPTIELMQSPVDSLNIPIMMGYNSKEGLLVLLAALRRNKLEDYETDLARLIPKSVNLAPDDKRSEIVAQQIRNYYLNGKKLCEDTLNEFADLLTDHHFVICSYLAAELHARYQSSPMYFYRFSVDKDLNLYKKFMLSPFEAPELNKFEGACHADEIYYLFKARKFIDPKNYPASETILRRTCELWTNFAKYGNPTPTSSNLIHWRPVKKVHSDDEMFTLNYLEMDNEELASKVNPDVDRMEFWREIYEEFCDTDVSLEQTA